MVTSENEGTVPIRGDGGAAESAAAGVSGGDAPSGAEVAEIRERWLRTAADLDNVRKRTARQIETETQRERERVIEAFLGVVDNLERALNTSAGGADNPWEEGMRSICNQMVAILGSFGIVSFVSVGDAFDPERHEAVAQIQRDGARGGVVVEETQRGYCRRDGSVLRVAKVVVAA